MSILLMYREDIVETFIVNEIVNNVNYYSTE